MAVSKSQPKRVFLHYLGWKQRYDEWVTLERVQILDPTTDDGAKQRTKSGNAERPRSTESPAAAAAAEEILKRRNSGASCSSVLKKLEMARKKREGEEEKESKRERKRRNTESVVGDCCSDSEEDEGEVGVRTRQGWRKGRCCSVVPKKAAKKVKEEVVVDPEERGGKVGEALKDEQEFSSSSQDVLGVGDVSGVKKEEEEENGRPRSAPVVSLGLEEKKEVEAIENPVDEEEKKSEEVSGSSSDSGSVGSQSPPADENNSEISQTSAKDEEEEEEEEDFDEEVDEFQEDEEEEDLDIGQSEGGETPAYGDEEGSRPNSIASPSLSSSKNLLGKKRYKRRKRNYSQMVTEGRKISKGVKKEATDSESEESHSRKDSGGSPKDSLAALKARLQLEMEQNPGAFKSRFNFTEMDPSWDSDKRISVMQQRLQEIRDTYQKIKTDLADLERSWRNAQEKSRKNQEEERRKERIKAVEAEVIGLLASSSATPTTNPTEEQATQQHCLPPPPPTTQ